MPATLQNKTMFLSGGSRGIGLAIALRAARDGANVALRVSRQAVVKHLALLDQARLVTGRRAGREMRRWVAPQRLGVTARWPDTVAAEWGARLAAIKHIAEASCGGGRPE